MTKTTLRALCLLTMMTLWSWTAAAQQLQLSHPHGFYQQPFSLTIDAGDPSLTVRYTLDGSEPTAQSRAYTAPLAIKGTTLLRAAAYKDGVPMSLVTTATYLFVDDVMNLDGTPQGYPDTWGRYTQISGTATADYGMDPEMTDDATLRPKIAQGLQSLPVLSIVTDKDNLFSHENDPDRGGIYIFTGPPVGDDTGHGWTRPASIEVFTPDGCDVLPQPIDFSATCGLRLHGGHGRLAEKNPKHSFRLVFKEEYGAKSLKYPVFGPDEPQKFDQLVLRCHFGNAWQHWAENNRQKAQYTRDVWARRIQRRMGRTSVNALYVNLFLNGMYWGMYNLAERVDDQFGKDHIGGAKTDIDVIKIEESGGNHIEASDGDLEAWEQMVSVATAVGYSAPDDNTAYYQLQGKDANGDDDPDQEALLDVDAFIDYMLINQYGGNTDWDHHNWYAIRRRGADSEGFRFLCWDSEIILESEYENVLSKNNGRQFPTGIFQSLLQNSSFARRYVKRAKELLSEEGTLGQATVVEVWDSLYNNVHDALYAEAARWGDYRRDVHRWQSAGQLYTVDDHYQAERQRLLTQYFPTRTEFVLSSILNYVAVDDFEAPAHWTRLTADMFHEWNGTGANAQPTIMNVNTEWNMGSNVGGGGTVAGFSGVYYNRFADLTPYDTLVLRGSGSGLRVLANRLEDHGSLKQIIVSFNASDPYWDASLQAIALPLDVVKTVATNRGEAHTETFVHLNAMKVDNGGNVNLQAAYLVDGQSSGVPTVYADHSAAGQGRIYNLQGQEVQRPSRGLYIVNGRKVVIKN
ncbi:MAG: CotH kinase family protein [Prevotella sp.]|nr:CotH kinase family protein [Prevotella sp.]